MSGSLSEARARVRAARTAVAETLTLQEREAWRRELELLEQVIESLTNRLHARQHREARS